MSLQFLGCNMLTIGAAEEGPPTWLSGEMSAPGLEKISS